MKEVNKLVAPTTDKLHIADREADVYDLFFHAFEPGTDLLVRARHNRSLKQEGTKLWDHIAQQPLAATLSLEIPDKQHPHKKRKAEVEVRYDKVEVRRPSTAKKDSPERVTLTAIEVSEINSSAPKKDRLHWKLLTTLEVNSLSEALQGVKWYCMRWLIERFHYVLKSGTKIEELQLKSAQRLQKAIMVYSIAAFRVMQLVYAGRSYPTVSCELVLTKAQWMTLYMLIDKNNQLPKDPPSLQQAVQWIGRLGGHLGRKSDGPPGLKTVWRGYQQLCAATSMYELINNTKFG